VVETILEFARLVKPEAQMVEVAQSFSPEIYDRERRAQGQDRSKAQRPAGQVVAYLLAVIGMLVWAALTFHSFDNFNQSRTGKTSMTAPFITESAV